jgi:hypothetical protein
MEYLSLFANGSTYFWGIPVLCSPEDKLARILGLLLAADIAQSEGK